MRLLLDTHVLVWLLEDSARITESVHAQIQDAVDADELYVSAITPWEIAMLVAKGRLRFNRDVADWIDAALSQPGIQLAPLAPAISVASTRLPWPTHPDPADRILMATSRSLDLTLVSADEQILDYAARGFIRCIAPW